MNKKTSCDNCVYYVYDEDYDCYTCTINLDEDDMSRFIHSSVMSCPHFRFNDEYKIVRKQN